MHRLAARLRENRSYLQILQALMSSDGAVVTSTLRHRDKVELIERLSDVIDTWNLSSSNERISINELIDPTLNHSDYTNFRPVQVHRLAR